MIELIKSFLDKCKSFFFDTDGVLTFNDDKNPQPGESAQKVVFKINPLQKGKGNAAFYIGQSVTSYGDWPGDEVLMLGWNLSPGGGLVEPGKPGLGLSFEQNYKPNDPVTGLTEMHIYYITPEGNQVRLFSYTINNLTKDIDFYQTLNRKYEKDINGRVYHAIYLGAGGEIVENYNVLGGATYQWNYSVNGLVLAMNGFTPLFLNTASYAVLPGSVLFHKGYTEYNNPVYINSGQLVEKDIPEYQDNADAKAHNLVIGKKYRTGDFLKIVH